MEAFYSILQTIFVCVVLGAGAMAFSRDANKLVLAPVERMVEKMDIIRRCLICSYALLFLLFLLSHP